MEKNPVKVKKQTRDDFIRLAAMQSADILEKEARIEKLLSEDKRLREQFSKVLGAPVTREYEYYSRSTQTTYSWEEIFSEVGKFLTFNRSKSWESSVDQRLESLEGNDRLPEVSAI